MKIKKNTKKLSDFCKSLFLAAEQFLPVNQTEP